MKKQTFFAVIFLALLTGCAVIESINPSYEIAKTEANHANTAYLTADYEDDPEPAEEEKDSILIGLNAKN